MCLFTKGSHYDGDFEGPLFEDSRMMECEEDVAASTMVSISAAQPVTVVSVDAFVRNLENNKMAHQTTGQVAQAESDAALFSYDSFTDISKAIDPIRMYVNQYLATRSGVTSKFSAATNVWYVALLQGTQDCTFTLRVSPSASFAPEGPSGTFRLTGKHEKGEKEYFNLMFDEVREFFARNGRSSAVTPRHKARSSNLDFYSTPEHLAILDRLIVDVQRRDAPRAQCEALSTLCDLTQDTSLVSLLHSRGCTAALITAMSSAEMASSSAALLETRSKVFCAAQCAVQTQMWTSGLIALSNLSATQDALLTIARPESSVVSELFIAVCTSIYAAEQSGPQNHLDMYSAAQVCEGLHRKLLGAYCEKVVLRLQELVQQRSPRGPAGGVSPSTGVTGSSTRSGKGYGVPREWSEQLTCCMNSLSDVSISINV